MNAAVLAPKSNGDEVIVNVNPGVASTYFVKYNDFNRRLIVNEVAFADTDVNIEKDSITIKNHGFITEQKVVYTAISPAGGLENNRIYYLYVQDADTIKLCPTLWEAQQFKPNFVNITSATAGNIGPINPPLNAYKDSTLQVINLTDKKKWVLYNTIELLSFQIN